MLREDLELSEEVLLVEPAGAEYDSELLRDEFVLTDEEPDDGLTDLVLDVEVPFLSLFEPERRDVDTLFSPERERVAPSDVLLTKDPSDLLEDEDLTSVDSPAYERPEDLDTDLPFSFVERTALPLLELYSVPEDLPAFIVERPE